MNPVRSEAIARTSRRAAIVSAFESVRASFEWDHERQHFRAK